MEPDTTIDAPRDPAQELEGGLDLPPRADRFSVCDEQSANFVVRKVVEARTYSARVKRWAEQETHRAAEEERQLLFLFEGQLRAWVAAEIEKMGGRRKSINLPAGRVGYRTLPAKLVIDDPETVLRWAKATCPDAVVVTERLSKSALDAHVAETGEIPDSGAHVERERETFFIR